eukprot:TRINITY_DN1154_c0_g1_i25.p1 TRINITY_DN1154_c0_g1~~TRINITY_DN1154_c0_g1_i25.p1  ORF type:complete len:217 (+),score=35.01 TRINITY_DN1154_c0_g1_i25:75-725(+)
MISLAPFLKKIAELEEENRKLRAGGASSGGASSGEVDVKAFEQRAAAAEKKIQELTAALVRIEAKLGQQEAKHTISISHPKKEEKERAKFPVPPEGPVQDLQARAHGVLVWAYDSRGLLEPQFHWFPQKANQDKKINELLTELGKKTKDRTDYHSQDKSPKPFKGTLFTPDEEEIDAKATVRVREDRTLTVSSAGKEIGRAVQQECRDRSRMPSSA